MDPLVAFLAAGDAVGDAFRLKGFSLQEDFTCGWGDEVRGEGAGLRPATEGGVGLAGGGRGLPRPLRGGAGLVWGVRSPRDSSSSAEEDEEEAAEGLAEVGGRPGVWTVGSEELLGTAGGASSSPGPGWLDPSDDRLSTLRAGDGAAEGGSE